MLYYSYPQTVVEEVPGEISLALSISGCPLRCKGCHSTFTYNPTYGSLLNYIELEKLLITAKHISCVLFYGGEWDEKSLIALLQYCKDKNLKTCLYTGYEFEDISLNIKQQLDYIKVGEYKEELGGLSSITTNQKFYTLQNGVISTELFLNRKI